MPRTLGFVLAALCVSAQTLAPETLLLARVKTHMSAVLQRLPNFTCRETVERSTRGAKDKRYKLVDALNFDVAVVQGTELYAWPGEREFKERDLREIAPNGAIGSGSFALHARSVFMSGTPRFDFRGYELLGNRETARYYYEVPQFRSGYQLRVGEIAGIAGYRGYFWADKETLDLLRLDVETFDIPPHVPIRLTTESLHYQRVPIGESDFLLPKSSEMIIEDVFGGLNRNFIQFANCRQYSGESKLSFDEAPLDAPAQPKPPIAVPAGLSFEIEIESSVKFGRSAIGDLVEGRIRKDIKRNGIVLLPKGAIVRGNVAYLSKHLGPRNIEILAVALRWNEIEFDQRTGPIDLELIDSGIFNNTSLSNRPEYFRDSFASARKQGPQPPRDLFYVRKSNLELPRGAIFFWRTRASGSSGAQTP